MANGARASVNGPNVVIGLCVMALGIALVLDRLGVIGAGQVLRYWPVGLILLGGSMVVQALRGGPDVGAKGSFPIGATIWLVLLGVLFTHVFDRRGSAGPDESGRVRLFAVMGGDHRNVDQTFRGADMTAVMGGVRLDLTHAQVAPGTEVTVDVFTMMGGAELKVPKDWTVDFQTTSILGGVDDNRSDPPGGNLVTRRRARREGVDVDALPPLPELPEPPSLSTPPSKATPPSPTPDVERPDQAKSAQAPPRLVVRGTVIMGGIVVKSDNLMIFKSYGG